MDNFFFYFFRILNIFNTHEERGEGLLENECELKRFKDCTVYLRVRHF